MSTKSIRGIATLALVLTAAASLRAATSGNTALFTMQGSGADLDFGDYVSRNGGALNASYRFFVEVPPGTGRLQLEVFDADIGLGGATEDTAGRDRDRNGYDSAVRYSVFNPAGAARTTSFTTGDAAGPAGSDNAWLSLFDSTGDFVLDQFTTAAYTNNNGLMNWSTNWIETNDDNNAGAGEIRITGGELRVGDNGGNASIIEREADLSGFATATLSFGLRTTGVDAGDQMRLQVSNNGGGAWTTLETFTGPFAATTRSYNITTSIAANTRIRFIQVSGYGNNDFFFVDNVRIGDSEVDAGHWEVRVDMSSAVTAGDDINAFGLRAHDGTAAAGGTELNVYADSILPLGVNPPNTGTNSRTYSLYPYITSGCSCSQNDFDFDSNTGNTGFATYESRTANVFSQTIASGQLSANGTSSASWNRDAVTGWTSDTSSLEYGIWSLTHGISSYLVGGTPNGNYASYYTGNFASTNPPLANPAANSFRVYLPTDGDAAPVKPFLEQMLTFNHNFLGPNPPRVGLTTTFTVTVRFENPTARAVVFSAANPVTANVPAGATYFGGAAVSQGSIVSQPAVGGTGDVVWSPGSVAAGATVILSYNVRVTPTSAGQRIAVTGTPASGNGTRARFVDETGNTTQARATYSTGGLCELAVTEGLLTDVLLSSFEVTKQGIEWTTASEAGTVGFNVYRADGTTRVNQGLIPANRKGRYRVDDAMASAGAFYVLEEVTASGRVNRYGPFNRIERVSPSARVAQVVPAAQPKQGKKPVAVMAGVSSTGIVRIPTASLAASLNASAGAVQAALRSGKISVTDNGNPIAWTTDGDALLFFGEKSTSIYSNERVYRIELTRGVTMASVPVSPASAPVSSFTTVFPIERDLFASTVLPVDPESDYWFWDFALAGVPGYDRPAFAVDVPALASADGAVLDVRLQGALNDATHHARVSLNGVPIGETSWSSFAAQTLRIDVPGGILRQGGNEIVVEGLLDGGSFDVFYIDGFTLTYSRLAQPEGGALEVSRGGTIAAGPFATAPVALDVTDRRRPAVLAGARFDGGVASFTAPPATGSLFLAESFVTPVFLRGSDEGSLKKGGSADWVVIAPRAFRAPAEALARVRQREGLAPLVVDLEQIYDEFAGGNRTPHAIRSFIASTAQWSNPPRYFALAGTGTFDYREIEGGAGPLPPLMTSTADGLFASDSLFADRNGDTIPDVAIGRIPAMTAEDLDAYVRKIDRPRNGAPGAMVFAADFTDRAADFRAASIQAAQPHEARPHTRVDLDAVGAAAGRTSLLDAWHTGIPLLSWTGHGGLDQLSGSGILTSSDAPSLTSTGALPVVVAMTCTINRFENGFVEPLGAALTRTPDGGALAVWSASGLSVHGDARELQNTFMRLAAQRPDARVGDLTLLTLTAKPSPTSGIYLLLGDPAVRLALPMEKTNVGTPGRSGE